MPLVKVQSIPTRQFNFDGAASRIGDDCATVVAARLGEKFRLDRTFSAKSLPTVPRRYRETVKIHTRSVDEAGNPAPAGERFVYLERIR